MRIIIVGAGEVGRHLAENLSSRLPQTTVIETSPELAAELDEQLDCGVLCANGASVTALAEADAALAAARQREANEEAKRQRLAAGELGLDIYDMRGRLKEKGLKYV